MIYKYQINWYGTDTLALPLGSKILSVLNQKETLVLYARVTNEEDMEFHDISVANTGDFIPEHAIHVGTVSFENGSIIKHVFRYP